MLVKQRDNEIGILLQYLNKKKAQGGTGGDTSVGDIPMMRDSKAMGMRNGNNEETKENGTLFQMMSGSKQPPMDASMMKSIKEKRIDFELNQTNAQKANMSMTGEMERVNQMLT